MRKVELPEDYALVLQEVNAVGTEDFVSLAESLRLERSRLKHILKALHHKRLIRVSRSAQDTWVSLSTRGERLMQTLWPESRPQFGY